MSSQTVSKFLVVDFTKENLKPNTASWTQACIDVRHALEEYGFFVAHYDQVSSELNKQVFDSLKELFDLPTETKSLNGHDLHDGYVGQKPGAPIYESTEIPDASILEGVQRFTNLMWPSGNKPFCDVILSYAKLAAELEKTVDRMVFESYGAQKHLERHIGSTSYLLQALKYGKLQEHRSSAKVGTSVHTDKGFLTILPLNNLNALAIQARNGEWIEVEFPHDCFGVMAGDAYEIWSNGRIHPPKHRGIIKGDETGYCAVLFSFNKGIIEVPEELVDEEHPLQFKPFDHFELLKYHRAGNGDKTGSIAKAYCGITI